MRKVHVGVEQREMVTTCCQHLHPCCCGDKEQHEDTQTCEKKNTAVMQLIALVALLLYTAELSLPAETGPWLRKIVTVTAPRRCDAGSDDAGFRDVAMLHMKVSRGCQTSVADTAICRSTGACGET